MTEKEVAELRRRFRQDKNSITHIRGCYVNDRGEILTQFDQPLSTLGQEEEEKMLALLKGALSGSQGKNLLDVAFSNEQVMEGEEHKLLMELRESQLRDENVAERFFQKVIEGVTLEENYLILLAYDTYDVPGHGKDGEEMEDSSTDVYRYILCAICPVKLTKPGLSYSPHENLFHNCKLDWVIARPALGFLFPAFDERTANIYNALYYTKSPEDNCQSLADVLFATELPMPAVQQKETFQGLLEESFQQQCSLERVLEVDQKLRETIAQHKEEKQEEPLTFSQKEVGMLLRGCGLEEEEDNHFEECYTQSFGQETLLSPKNVVENKIQVKTPAVTVQVDPQRAELIQTRVIDGVKYILIRADEEVTVNGVHIHIS